MLDILFCLNFIELIFNFFFFLYWDKLIAAINFYTKSVTLNDIEANVPDSRNWLYYTTLHTKII